MIFRIARHTTKLDLVTDFYIKILGLEKIGSFENHNDYDGIFIGIKNADWHLEFTVSKDIPVHHFDEDDILVFYPKTQVEYDQIIDNIKKNDIKILEPKNPYWKENGILIQDYDGYNVIISHLKIQ